MKKHFLLSMFLLLSACASQPPAEQPQRQPDPPKKEEPSRKVEGPAVKSVKGENLDYAWLVTEGKRSLLVFTTPW